MNYRVLIVDDEKNICDGLASAFEMEGYETETASDGNEALKVLIKSEIDLVITDLKMPKLSGEELLKKVNNSYPMIPVIILTGHGTVKNAVNAMRDGAYDFVTKPVDLDRILLLAKRALSSKELILKQRALQAELDQLKGEQKGVKVIGKSSPIQQILDLITQVAPTRASVLITGESGVGKEVIANAIHYQSERRDKPFIKVHCAALTESLLESELFGHEKGAFTGAVAQKKGRFELSDGGTIFLDEIGDISLTVQIKILRVLQERQFERVGGEKTISVDTRIIAATNRSLSKEIEKGNFREDLYYRLNVVNILVPPLRERREDIPLLISEFLKEISAENGKKIEAIDAKANLSLYNYSWPGNVRELRNCIESAVVMCKGHIITLDTLPALIRESSGSRFIEIPVGSSFTEAEKLIIEKTLHLHNGNKKKTADTLGIGRKTLYRKIEEYGVE